MKWQASILGASLFLSLPVRAGPPEGEIRGLIRQLASDEYEARERATEELERIGEPAVPALKEAAGGSDPEQSYRARKILEGIRRRKDVSVAARRHSGDGPDLHSSVLIEGVVIREGEAGIEIRERRRDPDGRVEEKVYAAKDRNELRERFPDVHARYLAEGGLAPKTGSGPGGSDEMLKELQERMREMREQMRRFGPWLDEDDFLQLEKALEPPAPRRFRLGVELDDVPPLLRAQLRLGGSEGVVVQKVVPGSAAEKAGLRMWDVVTAFDGGTVGGVEELRRKVEEAEGGRKIPLDAIREGKRLRLEVELEKR